MSMIRVANRLQDGSELAVMLRIPASMRKADCTWDGVPRPSRLPALPPQASGFRSQATGGVNRDQLRPAASLINPVPLQSKYQYPSRIRSSSLLHFSATDYYSVEQGACPSEVPWRLAQGVKWRLPKLVKLKMPPKFPCTYFYPTEFFRRDPDSRDLCGGSWDSLVVYQIQVRTL